MLSAQDDFVTIAIGAWLADPRTGEAGTEGMQRLLLEFFRNDELPRRNALAEETLMEELALLLDTRADAFRETAWPGISMFDYLRPMRPREMVQPLP